MAEARQCKDCMSVYSRASTCSHCTNLQSTERPGRYTDREPFALAVTKQGSVATKVLGYIVLLRTCGGGGGGEGGRANAVTLQSSVQLHREWQQGYTRGRTR